MIQARVAVDGGGGTYKVDNLEISCRVDHDVLWFEVSKRDAALVEMLQSGGHARDHELHGGSREATTDDFSAAFQLAPARRAVEERKEITALNQLGEYEYVVLVLERGYDIQREGTVLRAREEGFLVEHRPQELAVENGLLPHGLERVASRRRDVLAHEHPPEQAASKLRHATQILRGRRWGAGESV